MGVNINRVKSQGIRKCFEEISGCHSEIVLSD
jgi:hypothetical protein